MERVIQAHAEAEGIESDEVRRLFAIGTSMQCYMDPKEIADMIYYLSSDYARHVSRHVIGVDGFTETLYHGLDPSQQ